MQLRIFIVDDDPDYSTLVRMHLRRQGNPTLRTFPNGEAVLEALDDPPDLILLDLVMPGVGGLETLRRIKARHPDLPTVMVSAQSEVSVALEAIKIGAYDYVTKGHDDFVKLQRIVQHIGAQVALTQEVSVLREQLPGQGLKNLIGESAPMARVFRLIQKTLRGDLTVAILGESGTGKELVAQAIHYNSPRRRGPFVIVNCAAIPKDLMESEFFGHEKGAFTGAHARKMGKFEQADGGTIFLDEVGELDPALQAKLLRVLQGQDFQRVGGSDLLNVNVRVLCATNQDLQAMVRKGTFREDLYYRLFQFPLQLPPLRQREQDVLLLAEHFRKRYLEQHPDLEPRPLSAQTRRTMLRHAWPGNVRELKNTVERALLIADGSQIEPADLMLDLALDLEAPVADPAAVNLPPEPALPSPPLSPAQVAQQAGAPDEIVSIETLKCLALEHAYHVCDGNINRMAEKLEITRSTIYRLMKKYDLQFEDVE